MEECRGVGTSVNVGGRVVGAGGGMLRMKGAHWVSDRDIGEYECSGRKCALK